MSVHIAGMGWVTPLGQSVLQVWERLTRGEEAVAEPIADAIAPHPYNVFRVPEPLLRELPVHPRLRRASAISRFAAAAGLAAMASSVGAFLMRAPSMTTMIIMMLTTLATMSRKESPLTGSEFWGMGRRIRGIGDEGLED